MTSPAPALFADLALINKVLDSADMSRFIGLNETEFFDAKAGLNPYDLGTPMGRWELAKDACSFANSGGGFLIIGLKTASATGLDLDTVSALDLIGQADFHVKKYAGLIHEYVFPGIENLRVEWIASSADPANGVGVIGVPAQHAASKPFLISQLDDKGKKREIVFGVATRTGAHSVPHTKEMLRHALLEGSNEPSVRLSAIEKQLEVALEQLALIQDGVLATQPVVSQPAQPPRQADFDARIARALEVK